MSELLKKDVTIRIVAILFALALWLVVNPMKIREVSIPLNVINENTLKANNIEMKNKNFPRTIQVTIRGREDKINRINPNDFEAILDLAKINTASDNEIEIDGPVYKGKEEGIKIRNVWPKTVKVELESIVAKSFPIEIEPHIGTPKAGYKITEISIKPEKVVLREVESLIKRVGKVSVSLDTTDISKSVVKTQICKVLDKSGREITQLSGSVSVDIGVEVSKEVPVSVVITDKLSPDFVGGIGKVTPQKVYVTGSNEILEKTTELKTEPISIQGITKTTDIITSLILPDGLRLVGAEQKVKVSISVEPLIEREIAINNTDITLTNMDGSMDYIIQPPQVLNIRVKGLEKDINKITAGSLSPGVDVTELGEGTHKVPVNINLPYNVTLLEAYTVEVLIQKVPQESEQNDQT